MDICQKANGIDSNDMNGQTLPREKKPKTGVTIASRSHEQAGGLLLLAAATETGLLTQLEQALPPPLAPPEPPCLPLAGSAAVRRRLLLTVLFLGAVGLQRTWDLRGYTADGLALLTGQMRAYGYRYTEAFLSRGAPVPMVPTTSPLPSRVGPPASGIQSKQPKQQEKPTIPAR